MSQEEAESSIIYEEPIDIPLEDDDDEDELEEENSVPLSSQADQENAENESDDSVDNVVGSETPRSVTGLSVDPRDVADEEDEDEEGEDEDEDEDDNDVDNEDENDNDNANENENELESSRDKRAPPAVQTSKRYKKYPKLDPAKAPPGKKVPLHLLEKRRLGRIKAAEEFAKTLKKIGIEKVETTTLPATGLFQPLMLINQKNYSSDYLKKDDQIFALRDRKFLRNNNTSQISSTNTPDVIDLKSLPHSEASAAPLNDEIDLNDPTATIVIHPGSNSIKIGFPKDDHPVVVPNCVAVPKKWLDLENSEHVENVCLQREQSEDFNNIKSEMEKNFRERMRYYKRKVPGNAHEQVVSFNENSKPEIISEKNDPSPIEWIFDDSKLYYGSDALRCVDEKFVIRKPFRGGSFNVKSPYYKSLAELISDVTKLLEHALNSETLNVKPTKFNQYKVVLVIPDVFKKSHVETFIRVLLTELQFQAVAIIQESLATCYGAGISTSTCVVNIGAAETRIACVDEGTVLEHSAITLDYGGDDITRLFALFLLQSDFPLQDWKIDSKHGWLLAERLKKNFTTFQDADVAVQLYNFMNRSPNQPTEKYEFKLFDEVMLAPLALFFPQIFKLIRTSSHKNSSLEFQLPESRDLFTNELNDWNSLSQFESKEGNLYCDLNDDLKILNRILDAHNIIDQLQDKPENYGNTLKENFAPLEKAIVQSIANASITADVTRMNSFYSNILIVGGSSKIPALDFILTDRINIWRPSLLSSASFPQFYKKLTKEIKELEGHYVNAPDKTEDENKQILQAQIKEKIVEELEEQHQNIEHQNGNEHIFPVSIIPPPRDMNPALIIWKGASVLAQIKLVEELFITNSDWDVHGSRILQYKCIFTY
ncbi:BAQ_1a_G0050250.mRNA.1.CDS.1 [Saccharomyces cerevisiae]|nr:Arp8p [Saccharomyces cerevisiae YJM1418]CAI4785791.1 BAQ_1a_G0050250.mRNA.1.CDS.1 [Saccharomyces cerevisiae]CAI4803933.1 BAM_G0050150.mRNA.1.CDS.1 [Saccharomyces cerevisiae]CAI7340243.1 BAM_G0050150.mRNA.1.CDS.1 [Saccharomyces cerevisiae]CAI7342825.1 BAQ_1a_G0050250.mRNA.1.CDS.1 [Saccharomyces cerevisiae]